VIVKIDPADVVSIPSDYNNQKGRCCKYMVIREVELQDRSHESLPEERIEGIVLQDPGSTAPDYTKPLIAQIIPLTGEVKQYYDSVSAAAKIRGSTVRASARSFVVSASLLVALVGCTLMP